MRSGSGEDRRGWGLGQLPQGVFSAGIPVVKKLASETQSLLRQVEVRGRSGRQVLTPFWPLQVGTLMAKYLCASFRTPEVLPQVVTHCISQML